jgi:TldD protein
MVQLPNLTMEPGREETSVEDLIADTRRGLYVDWGYGASDQQLLSGQYRGASPREIRNGKLGDYLDDMAFQFLTPQLWKNLEAIGGAGSARATYVDPESGSSRDALQLGACTVWAVPARFRQVNVLNVGRTA